MLEKKLKEFSFICILATLFPLIVCSQDNATCTTQSLRDCKCSENQILVNCSSLQLKVVPAIPKENPVEFLDLSNNSITDLTDELIELTQLATLDISENPFQCDVDLLTWVNKWLKKSDNNKIIGNCSIAFGQPNVPIESLEGQDVVAFSDVESEVDQDELNVTMTTQIMTTFEELLDNSTTPLPPGGESDNTVVIVVVCVIAAVALVSACVIFVCLKRKKKNKRKSKPRRSEQVYKGDDKWKYEGVKSRDPTTEL